MEQDSSLDIREDTNANDCGNTKEKNQRSNWENMETKGSQPDKYMTRYGRRVIRPQIWLASREKERVSRSRQKTAMNCTVEEQSSIQMTKEHGTFSLCPQLLEISCTCTMN